MIRSLFAAPAGSELGNGLWANDPPAADPSSLSASFYGDEFEGVKVRLQWVNGDVTAYTLIGFSADAGTEPTTVWMSVSPGVTLADTERAHSSADFWWVRHTKGGTPGDWVGGVRP